MPGTIKEWREFTQSFEYFGVCAPSHEPIIIQAAGSGKCVGCTFWTVGAFYDFVKCIHDAFPSRELVIQYADGFRVCIDPDDVPRLREVRFDKVNPALCVYGPCLILPTFTGIGPTWVKK